MTDRCLICGREGHTSASCPRGVPPASEHHWRVGCYPLMLIASVVAFVAGPLWVAALLLAMSFTLERPTT